MQYKWTVLTNTTLGGLMSSINMNIVMISLPTILRGLGVNPLAQGEFTVLLWILMGYSVVLASVLVTFGRISDMYGRTRLYTIGFIIFTIGAVLLSIIPDHTGDTGAYILIALRIFQAVGGGFLMVTGAAIITDAFPPNERGKALGINMVSFTAGSLIGLFLGGMLAAYNWHLVFVASVPFAVAGSLWSVLKLKETAARVRVPLDYTGNLALSLGLILICLGFTYSLVPYGNSQMGWGNPWVVVSFIAGLALLAYFVHVERISKHPLFDLRLFRIKPFAYGNIALFLSACGRGAVMFLVIIWLQGIYLPLHGISYTDAPLWAGIYMFPMTIGVVVMGPIGGWLTDRYGARHFATAGMLLIALSLFLLSLLPYDFDLFSFEAILFLNGFGTGLFTSPNTTAIMNSLPAKDRGAGNGIRTTLANIAQTISMAVFFSLALTIFSQDLPGAMFGSATAAGVPAGAATALSKIPPSSALFAALLGVNPLSGLPAALTAAIPAAARAALMSTAFFPNVIGPSFMIGLRDALYIALALTLIGAVFSWMRGGKYIHQETPEENGAGVAPVKDNGEGPPENADDGGAPPASAPEKGP